MLTNKELLETYLPENNFILFKPKEIVSGDFYYVNKIKDYLIFAVADCTGHGVSGGFITVLGITYLHEVIKREETNNPAIALESLRVKIKAIFKTFGTENQNGLDIALCAIDTKTDIMQYAGANNPLWIVRDDELIEYKATRNPIGYYPKERNFECNKIQLQKNDKIYLFSDGYKDQFGGKYNQKFTNKRFRQMIKEVSKMPMSQQNELLEKTLEKWIGASRQIDDIALWVLNGQKNNLSANRQVTACNFRKAINCMSKLYSSF